MPKREMEVVQRMNPKIERRETKRKMRHYQQ
jgi:hypothetical protein